MLRAVEQEDIAIFFEQQDDPVASAMAAFPIRDRAAHDAHWAKLLADDSLLTRTIVEDGEVVGNIGSWVADGERAVGYVIGRPYWGRGYATRALADLVAEVPDRPIHAHVAEHNVASLRVLTKCGFSIVGEEDADGDDVKLIIMRLDAQRSPDVAGSDGVTVRPWQARDRAAVTTLLRILDHEADRVLTGPAEVADGAPAYVAERDGAVVGMVTLCVYTTLTGAKAYLEHLVVDPAARRSGIGRRLVEYAIERAQEAGASRVDLTARSSKRAAHALYRSLGFERRETTNLRLLITERPNAHEGSGSSDA